RIFPPPAPRPLGSGRFSFPPRPCSALRQWLALGPHELPNLRLAGPLGATARRGRVTCPSVRYAAPAIRFSSVLEVGAASLETAPAARALQVVEETVRADEGRPGARIRKFIGRVC